MCWQRSCHQLLPQPALKIEDFIRIAGLTAQGGRLALCGRYEFVGRISAFREKFVNLEKSAYGSRDEPARPARRMIWRDAWALTLGLRFAAFPGCM